MPTPTLVLVPTLGLMPTLTLGPMPTPMLSLSLSSLLVPFATNVTTFHVT